MDRGDLFSGSALALELAPAAALNFAVAFAAASWLREQGLQDIAAPASIACGLVAFVGAWAGLHHAGGDKRRLALPQFDCAEPEWIETEPCDGSAPEDELLLDDILAEVGPQSRVVRLFDPAAMPTAGELHARIDRHLGGLPPADATGDLNAALAALRQSLR